MGSDYYGQTATADPTDATLIQSSILTDSTATGIITERGIIREPNTERVKQVVG